LIKIQSKRKDIFSHAQSSNSQRSFLGGYIFICDQTTPFIFYMNTNKSDFVVFCVISYILFLF